ncbi:hypothetical protein ABK040_010916 [Willaertia magna]
MDAVNLFSVDVLYEISNFIFNLRDYYNLALTNKYFYNNMLLQNENKSFLKILDGIFKNKKIKLNNNLPNFLFNLENLNIYDQILQNLPKLEILSVNYCIFKINSFSHLKHLKSLNINQGRIPEGCLNDLINLNKLKITKLLQFKGEYLKNLKQLKELNCNYISSLEENSINELQNLTKLKLNGCNNISGNLLQNLKNLKVLKIIDCYKMENDLHNISSLIYLKKLTIKLSNTNSSFVKNLHNLEYLKIKGNDLKDEDFYNFKNLKYLSVEGFGSIDNCFNHLNKLEKFKCDLKLIKNLNSIKHIKKLYILSMPNNITDKDLKQFTNNIIQLYCYSNITGECFSYLNNLENLIIMRNENITDSHLEINNLTNLKKLHFEKCPNIITGQFLLKMRKLKKLIAEYEFDEIYEIKEQIENGVSLWDIIKE